VALGVGIHGSSDGGISKHTATQKGAHSSFAMITEVLYRVPSSQGPVEGRICYITVYQNYVAEKVKIN